MPHQFDDKYYLEEGDTVECYATLEYKNTGFVLYDWGDSELRYFDQESSESYQIQFDREVPRTDSNYGKPYYTKD